MIEDPNKPDDTLDATARDYLGKPSPLAFKNQPALPSGGGSIGVGAGPNTTAGGTGAGSVRRSASFAEMLQSLGLTDPSAGGGEDGGTGGGPGVTGPSEGNVTGLDAGLAATGLNAAALAAGVPGVVGTVGALTGTGLTGTSVPGVGTAINAATGARSGLSAVADVAAANTSGKVGTFFDQLSQVLNYSDLSTPSGNKVAALHTGLIDAARNAAGGHANFATSSDPAVAAMIAQNPALLSDPAFMAAPLSDGRTVSDTISPVDNSLSPGVAMNPGTFGFTSMPGQVGFAGAPGGPNMAQGGTGAPSNSGYGGYSGISGDPSAPGAINFGFSPTGQGRGDTGNSGGGNGDGTFLCTALHKRGLMDDATLDANHRFARTMTRAEYVGYARWARPLAQWGDRHPRAAMLLYAVAGFLPRAYMQEIKTPGSSRLGRVVLAVGLRVCAKLGAPRARRRLA